MPTRASERKPPTHCQTTDAVTQEKRTCEYAGELSAAHFTEALFNEKPHPSGTKRLAIAGRATVVSLWLIAMVFVPHCVLGGETNRPGLIGAQFGESDLKNWQRAVLLTTLDQSWSKADDYGHEWSARWRGFVRAPATGEIKFHVETNKSVDLRVNGRTILEIDPGETRKSGSVLMEKGRLYPIEVSFYNARGFDAYLKLTWSWDRQVPVSVPPENLSHSLEQEHAADWVSGEPDPSQPTAPRERIKK